MTVTVTVMLDSGAPRTERTEGRERRLRIRLAGEEGLIIILQNAVRTVLCQMVGTVHHCVVLYMQYLGVSNTQYGLWAGSGPSHHLMQLDSKSSKRIGAIWSA